jgi:tetratricopeptide (TPR) repeat protein
MNRFVHVAVLLGALVLAGTTTTGCKPEPDPAQIHRQAGDLSLRDGRWSQAAKEYGESLDAAPAQEKVWERKAFAHMQAGELDAAEAALLRTLEFRAEPERKAEVYRNVAGMFLQKNAPERAEKYFAQAAAADPRDALSIQWLAEMASQRGGARDGRAPLVAEELQKALGYYDQALAVRPDDSALLIGKRIVLAKFLEDERLRLEEAEKLLLSAGGSRRVANAAKASVAEHQTQLLEFKRRFDEVTLRLREAHERSKAAAAPVRATM